jgi:hypothetical protein
MICLCLAEHDDDPREIYDIAEVAAFYRWARLAGIDAHSDLTACHPTTWALLAACGCFGPEVKWTVKYLPKSQNNDRRKSCWENKTIMK